MNAWEYLIVALPAFEPAHAAKGHSSAVDTLNREGADGWEAVGMTTLPDLSIAVLLKRHSRHDQESRRGRPGRFDDVTRTTADGSLRVAVLAPIAWRTPPRHYGPWEQFASLLADGLVAAGHQVTLFATADSITSAALSGSAPAAWNEDDTIDPKVAECLHIAAVFERADEFDVIHNGFDFLPLTYSRLVETPVVTTIHGFSSERIVEVYARYGDRCHYVAISDADRHPRLRYAATVHHGIDTAAFAVDPAPGERLLFFGRIHPDKGTAVAIDVARRAGRQLDIAGIVHDETYFRTEVEPHIDGSRVRYLGPVPADERAQVLGHAHALLHLIDFDEPFGYSVVEAMACGTPVIVFPRGSMRELIDDGVTGHLVANRDDAVAAAVDRPPLERTSIRERTAVRFDVSTMVDKYVDVYRSLANTAAPLRT